MRGVSSLLLRPSSAGGLDNDRGEGREDDRGEGLEVDRGEGLDEGRGDDFEYPRGVDGFEDPRGDGTSSLGLTALRLMSRMPFIVLLLLACLRRCSSQSNQLSSCRRHANFNPSRNVAFNNGLVALVDGFLGWLDGSRVHDDGGREKK